MLHIAWWSGDLDFSDTTWGTLIKKLKFYKVPGDNDIDQAMGEPVTSRGACRDVLARTFPPGQEQAMLLHTFREQCRAEDRLAALLQDRVRLQNLLHERQRKLREAKAKYRRRGDESEDELTQRWQLLHKTTVGPGMPWVEVGRVEPARTPDHPQRFLIRCHPAYADATDGLAGFGKVWVIGVGTEEASCEDKNVRCHPIDRRLVLALVDILNVSPQGVVEVSGSDAQCLLGTRVMDLKPYLSYAEAREPSS